MDISQDQKSKRNIPLKNWIDAAARHQIINQAIFEEFVLSIWEKRKNWTARVRKRLKPYGISLAESTLKGYLAGLKSGSRSAVGTSAFGNKLFKEFGCRSGKDGMYKQVEILEHMYIPEPVYVGLPANQIVHIIRKYGTNTYACEIDQEMFRFMFTLKRHLASDIPATLLYSEILDFLETTSKKFSIYDLDFMQHMKPDLVSRIASCIARTTKDLSVVSIASCIGRSSTEEDYKSIMPDKIIREIQKHNCCVKYIYSGGYNDSVTPMRYELLVVQKYRRATWKRR